MGWEAVPSPMKNRTIEPGYQPPTEDAAGLATLAAGLSKALAGSPLVVVAAAFAGWEWVPNSRRVTASAVHIRGVTADELPLAPWPVTEPGAAAAAGLP